MTGRHPLKLHWLNPLQPQQAFPDAALALTEPDGLLAAGGCLSPQRLLNAYRHGIFPWYNAGEPLLWWSPNPRCVFANAQVQASHSLQKTLQQQAFALSFNRSFAAVLNECAAPRPGQRGTWITPQIHAAYQQLHQLGHAHSVELWQHGQLVGGLYGVAIGGAFFGESMFSRVPNASKIALVQLATQLRQWGFGLLDAQVVSPHLLSMGATALPRAQFMAQLQHWRSVAIQPSWQFDAPLAGNAAHLGPAV